jgi:hypothetical protein
MCLCTYLRLEETLRYSKSTQPNGFLQVHAEAKVQRCLGFISFQSDLNLNQLTAKKHFFG